MSTNPSVEFQKLQRDVDSYAQALIDQIKGSCDRDMVAYGQFIREIKRFYARTIENNSEQDVRKFISKKLDIVQQVLSEVTDINRVCVYAANALLNDFIRAWNNAKTKDDYTKVFANAPSAHSQDAYLNSAKAYIEYVNKSLETRKTEALSAELETLKQQLAASQKTVLEQQEQLDTWKKAVSGILGLK